MMKKRAFISLVFNILIIYLTIIAFCVAIIDVKLQNTNYGLLFIYYTTLSNLFLFVSSVFYFVYLSFYLSNKIKKIPNWVNILKMCATTTTTITMLVVICFLTPMFANNPDSMGVGFLYAGSNCIFHVINPILGIISFLLFEHTKEIKFPQISFSIVFTFLYEIFYTLDIFLEFVPIDPNIQTHDWYNFLTIVGGNKSLMPLILLAFLAISFGIAWLLWLGNRKIKLFNKQKIATK